VALVATRGAVAADPQVAQEATRGAGAVEVDLRAAQEAARRDPTTSPQVAQVATRGVVVVAATMVATTVALAPLPLKIALKAYSQDTGTMAVKWASSHWNLSQLTPMPLHIGQILPFVKWRLLPQTLPLVSSGFVKLSIKISQRRLSLRMNPSNAWISQSRGTSRLRF